MTQTTTTDWLALVEKDRLALAKAELSSAKLRRLFYNDICSAFQQVRMGDLVLASGLTRQRIYQIIQAEEKP